MTIAAVSIYVVSSRSSTPRSIEEIAIGCGLSDGTV